jgi:hypothetical protein
MEQAYPVHHQRATNVCYNQQNQQSRNPCRCDWCRQPYLALLRQPSGSQKMPQIAVAFSILTKTGTMAAFNLHIETKRLERRLDGLISRNDLTPCRFPVKPRTVSTHSRYSTLSSVMIRTLQANNCFQCCVQAPPMLEAITINALNRIGALLPTRYSERGSYDILAA